MPPVGLEAGDTGRSRRNSKRRPRRQLRLDHLPREQITIEPDVDTTGLVSIGAEKTQLLEYEPARFKAIEYIRPKYTDSHNPGGASSWPICLRD